MGLKETILLLLRHKKTLLIMSVIAASFIMSIGLNLQKKDVYQFESVDDTKSVLDKELDKLRQILINVNADPITLASFELHYMVIMPDNKERSGFIKNNTLNYYKNLLAHASMRQIIGDNMEIDDNLVKLLDARLTADTLALTITHSTSLINKKIADCVDSYIKSVYIQAEKIFGKHEIKRILMNTPDLLEEPLLFNTLTTDQYYFMIFNYLNNIRKRQKFTIKRAVQIHEAPQRPFLALTFISVFCAALISITIVLLIDAAKGGKVATLNKMKSLAGNNYLGCISTKKHKSRLEIFEEKISGLGGAAPYETEAEILYETLSAALDKGAAKNILLTGSIDLETLEKIQIKLNSLSSNRQLRFLSGSDVNYSLKTVETLKFADAVVLIENLKKSSVARVENEIQKLLILNFKICGFVILR